MVEILIFAILSIYLFARLWSVFGTSVGNEKKPDFSIFGKVDDVPQKNIKDVEVEVISPLDYEEQRLSAVNPNFSFSQFLKGAKNSFIYIIQAYSKGEEQKLKKLMNEKVFKQFQSAIKQRKKAGTLLDIEILELEGGIYAVQLENNTAFITVRFHSKQVTNTKDKGGDNRIQEDARVTDTWKFSKDLTDQNPNWQLIETS